MATENRQKIPVPRRSFLWSLNETSGEILTHVGPTEFTPSANDRIVRSNDRGGYESAAMEARPFVVARDGEYVVLSNPIRGETTDDSPNGPYVPGGNKEKELVLGTTKIVPGPCAFPLWPGQSAEVRPAHKLGANHYLLVEVVGPLDEKARYYRLVIESAGLSSAVIDSGENEGGVRMGASPTSEAGHSPTQLRLGQRIVIQGRHTQLFVPPSGIDIVAPMEDAPPSSQAQSRDSDDDGVAALPPPVAQELGKLLTQVREGVSAKQFSVLKNELRHRRDLDVGQRAVMLTALDAAFDERQSSQGPRTAIAGADQRRTASPMDPYARRAVVLGPKEFCVLFDADGNPRIVRGPARVFPGPHDTFLQRGSRRRVYDAYELAEHQALWLRIITPISRERLATLLPPGYPLDKDHYDAGTELIVKGLPSVFFPFIEAEVINPVTREPHVGNDHDNVIMEAIGIDQKSGVYVRDRRTGMVKMVRGETSYMVDPRFEEHVQRAVPREMWNLTVGHCEPHKVTKDEMVRTPWAVSLAVPNNEACLITSRHGRRVETGPKVVLLGYEEQVQKLTLSRGPSKDGKATVATCFLRVQGGRVADTFEVESADFVRFKVRLGFAGHFEGAEPEKWFAVDDPVKLLADTVRARLREAARGEPATRLLTTFASVVRTALMGAGALKFEENGMVVDQVDVLSVQVADGSLAELFNTVQREAVKLQLHDQQTARRVESVRHQEVLETEEAQIRRSMAKRKGETTVAETEIAHVVALKTLELESAQKAEQLAREQAHQQRVLDFEVRSEQAMADAAAQKKLREAEASAQSEALAFRVHEAHLAEVSRIERERAAALAEADAARLKAIQPELVGALHAAADSEVMKAAATNMNLVALLGGKSPSEIFRQLLRGTPLERTPLGMLARSIGNGEGAGNGVKTGGDAE